MKSPEKFIDDIISLFKYNDLIKNASKTPTGFILQQKTPDWISIIFPFMFIVIPAVTLMYSDFNLKRIILSLIWVIFIGYTFYNAIVSDNRVEFNLTRRTVEIQNLNVLTKYLFKRKTIEFGEIDNIQIKSVNYSSHGLSSSRLVLNTKSNKAYVLNEYTSDFVARKLKFATSCIIAENRMRL